MDIKNNEIYITRVELDESKETNNKKEDIENVEIVENNEDAQLVKKIPKEKIIFIGRMEDNENFEEDPTIEDGALNTLIEASGEKKTNIFEVDFIIKCN